MTVEDVQLITGGVWLLVVLSIVGAHAAGYRLGRRLKAQGQDAGQIGTVQGALLGLLGLLLAFSFSSAAGRFADRQELVLQEANAIGTAYLRADLLPAPHGDALRAALSKYVDVRVALHEAVDLTAIRNAIERSEQLQQTIWAAGVAGVTAAPAATVVVMNALNEVIDLHASRVDALHRHLPAPVVVMLLVTAMLAVGSVGLGSGLSGTRRAVSSIAFLIVTMGVLGLTLDLDYPRAGVVRVGQLPMLDLQRSLHK